MFIQDNVTAKLIELEEMPERVFRQAMDWAEKDFQKQFDVLIDTGSDNITFRRNGQVITPGTPRDLVDLGNLKRSQRRDAGPGGVEVEVKNTPLMFMTDMCRSLQVGREGDLLSRDLGLKLRLENLREFFLRY